MALSRSHKLRRQLVLASVLFAAALAMLNAPASECAAVFASDTQPSDYCYQTDLAITYSGGGTVTNQAVRVEINADGLIDSGQMDERSWDLKPTLGSIANEVHLTTQDLGATDSAWWVIVPEIDDAETRTHRIYSGSGEQRRDQSIFFTGGDYLVATDHADFDITDDLQIDMWMENVSGTARNGNLLSKRNSNIAYSISMTDVASALYLTFAVDADSCQVAWDSSWTGVKSLFSFQYTAGAGTDIWIYRDGVEICSDDIDEGAIGTNAENVYLGSNVAAGTKASDVQISQVEISAAGVLAARWGFDATSMTETSSSNPYAGTVADYSGNGHTLTYSFDRDQTDWAYTLGATQLVSGASQITLPDANPDVLGPAFGVDLSSAPAELQDGILYNVVLEKWLESAPFASFGYAMILSFVGLLFAIGTWRLTKYMPMAIFMFGMPLAIGVGNGWIQPWWMAMWVVAAAGGWFAQKHAETN